eukprot:TRINITY_DN4486_c0_g1_i1.p2 TRINITY_DN4486_c0_g1~~TRINITY_DN4486_c0_g1_i1.p2  ORF type:complete len:312 (-),score=47.11 TRINITY_DN4486_c0_g1_i1:1096-2031(-)
MRVIQRLGTQHDDLIHDIAYDFYGKRMATCSSDQQIKVWDLDTEGDWKCTAQWKAHSGSVWKLDWVHPEFGQVLASCSFDRTVSIWEEAEDSEGRSTWNKRATLVDSRDSVLDIKFAPRHLGLKLATCSSDGFIRIYEAIDVMNLAHWPLMEEFEAHKDGATSISWNPSPFSTPNIVVGTATDSVAKIWEYNDQYRRWQQIEALTGHKDVVHDVSWAPNLGRTFHLIATSSRDQTVRIWRYVPASLSNTGKSVVQEVAKFADHRSEVWRVEWNITGTILASSGDDGAVRLWKANFANQWESLSTIRGEEDI